MLFICFLLLFGYNNITWLKKPLAPDLRASLFSRMKKKRSCSLRSNSILIFQTSTFRGSILRSLTIVCVNAVIISATIDPEDCITTISAQPGLSYQMITIFSWKKEKISRNVQSWDLLLLSGSKWEISFDLIRKTIYILIFISKSTFEIWKSKTLWDHSTLSRQRISSTCVSYSHLKTQPQKNCRLSVCALWLSPFKRPNRSPKGRV